MEEFFLAMKLVFSVAVVGILSWILSVYGNLWHESQRVRKRLQMQGIKGPPPSFLHWNLPNMQRIQSQTKADSTFNSNHSDQFLAPAIEPSLSSSIPSFVEQTSPPLPQVQV